MLMRSLQSVLLCSIMSSVASMASMAPPAARVQQQLNVNEIVQSKKSMVRTAVSPDLAEQVAEALGPKSQRTHSSSPTLTEVLHASAIVARERAHNHASHFYGAAQGMSTW